MLYVNDVEQAKTFWCERLDFKMIKSQALLDKTSYVIAPEEASDVQFVLHDKATIQQLSPEVNTATPSILLNATNIKALHQHLLTYQDMVVGDIQDMGEMLVFNFADLEGNYFALSESK